MSICDSCKRDCMLRSPTIVHCEVFVSIPTNADRIRSMTDEELARYFCDEYGCPIGRGYPECI